MDVNALLSHLSAHETASLELMVVAFLAGLLVSFTPCIYPMIPITAGILQSQASNSIWRNLLQALAYAIGIALVYASLGYFSATTGLVFGSWLASPWFVGGTVAFFVYLGLAMIGLYELFIPHFVTSLPGTGRSASLLGALTAGLVAGTVASPCLTPALALLLALVAKMSNPLLGFASLFCFAIGMSFVLILIGTFSSTLTLLPQAGNWMENIKQLLGFLMLATSIYFLKPFVPGWGIYAGYGAVAAYAGWIFIAQGRDERLARLLGIAAVLVAIGMTALALRSATPFYFG